MLDSTIQTKCWTVTATNDSVYEDDTELVTLNLVIMSQSGVVTIGDPSTTVVSIMDNDCEFCNTFCTLLARNLSHIVVIVQFSSNSTSTVQRSLKDRQSMCFSQWDHN